VVLNDGTKVCNTCGKEQPRTDFNRSKKNADGRRGICRSCVNGPNGHYQRNREQVIAYQKARYVKDKEGSLAYHRQRKYGVTPEQVAQMLYYQDGGCAVCGHIPSEKDKKGLGLDHCHATGKVRGLLCVRCNAALGMINDSVDILSKLIIHVQKYSDD
jgi:hypothetical protein